MVLMADPWVILERKVRQRVRDDESHRRIAEVLTEVAVAAIHPARQLGIGRGSYGMLEDPIESSVHAAVETLIDRLEDLVETMPGPIVDQLASEQLAAELGTV
jgi:hypothetical protein